jgi:hypothetical protein
LKVGTAGNFGLRWAPKVKSGRTGGGAASAEGSKVIVVRKPASAAPEASASRH